MLRGLLLIIGLLYAELGTYLYAFHHDLFTASLLIMSNVSIDNEVTILQELWNTITHDNLEHMFELSELGLGYQALMDS